jgi:molybdopterin molybdotransferase
MISVDQAWQLVMKEFSLPQIEEVSLLDSLGRILAEDILADRDGPPFDRVTMDGIAIDSKQLESQLSFKIESVAKAGEAQKRLLKNQNAIEIMTGALLPFGCDTVIRYEDLKIESGVAHITASLSSRISNIHFKGSDFKKNDIIVKKGHKILAPMIGILASSGKSFIKVVQHPKIAIVSTGDELVEITEAPLEHQIRRSNLYALDGLLKTFGFHSTELVHLPDEPKIIYDNLKTLIANNDVVILSGGVSEGKFDFIPQTLNDLGVREIFHKVSQRPGKPLWFGKKEEKMIPGNPVSCLVCLRRYFIEAEKNQMTDVILEADAKVSGDRVFFQAVKLRNCEGKMMAYPLPGNGSGDYLSLKGSDGFIELDPMKNPFHKNQVVKFFSWSNQ